MSDEEQQSAPITKMLEQMKAGTLKASDLPEEYLEPERIIAPTSKEGQVFQAEMEKLVKLLLPDFDLKERPVVFVLSDKKEHEDGHGSGYIIPGDKTSIICFDRELFRGCDNLNQFAYVFLHEMTHMKVHDFWGQGESSKVEETACDLRPLVKMAEAGLDMNEAKVMMQKRARSFKGSFRSGLGAHPLPWYRVDQMENGLAAIRTTRGTLGSSEGKKILSFPDAISPTNPDSVVSTAHYTSFVEAAFAKAGYDKQTTAEKLVTIESIIPDCAHLPFRLYDLYREVTNLKTDPKDPTQAAILHRICDKLLDYPEAFNSLYVVVENKLFPDPEKRDYPQGRIANLAKATEAFIGAKTLGSAEAAAKVLLEQTAAIKTLPDIRLLDARLPHFELKSANEYKTEIKDSGETRLPWRDHARWVLDKKSKPVLHAMVAVGALDPRFIGAADADDLKVFKDITPITSPRGGKKGEVSLSNLKVDFTGAITKFLTYYEGSQLYIPTENSDHLKSRHADFCEKVRQMQLKHAEEERTRAATKDIDRFGLELTFVNMEPAEFAAKHVELLETNRHFLAVSEEELTFTGDDAQKARMRVSTHAKQLSAYFDKMMADKDPARQEQYKQIIRSFFLKATLPVNIAELQDNAGDLDRLDVNTKSLQFEVLAPFYRFLSQDKYQLFSAEEKAQVLIKKNADEPLAYWRAAFHYEAPKNLSEALQLMQQYKQFQVLHAESVQGESSDGENRLRTAATGELMDYVIKSAQPDEQLWQLAVQYEETLEHAVNGMHGYDNTLSTRCRKKYIDYLKAEKNWPDDIESLGKIYHTLSQCYLFPDEEWRSDFAKRITDKIANFATADERIIAAESILFRNKGQMRDVDLRKQAMQLWVDACKTKYGLDDGTQAYHDAVKPLVQRLEQNAAANMRYEMLKRLGDELNTQHDLSHTMEKAVYSKVSRQQMTGKDEAIGISHRTLDTLRHAGYRNNAVKFLSRPLTKDSLKAFAQKTNQAIWEDVLALSDQTHSGENPLDKIVSEKQRMRIVTAHAKQLYENFWEAPMPIRTAIMKELLLPPKLREEDRKEGHDKTFEDASKLVLDELLPEKMPYATQAKELLKAFLAKDVLDENQRPAFLSALMSAVQRSNAEGGTFRVGQRLATLLDLMGPAWKKLGQAISSHPDTPQEIARDMEPLKGKQDMPRWQMWALYEKTVPEALRKKHPHLGKVLGSASFFTAVDAGDSVFVMQAPYAKERADDGFSIMQKFVAELKTGKYDIGATMPDSIADMIASARISAGMETNGHVGAEQAKAMASVYNGASVNVNAVPHTFETAIWTNYGDEFRQMKKMDGEVFNAVAYETDADKQAKHHAAKAQMALELYNILSGKPFDPDRHGQNFRLKGTHMGLFDHGAVHAVVKDKAGKAVGPDEVDAAIAAGGTIEIPAASAEDRKLLATALIASFKSLKDGTPLANVLHTQIEQAKKAKGSSPDYLIRVERGLLALNDSYKYLDKEGKDLIDIFAGLYNGGGKKSHIHPDIREELENAVASGELGEAGKYGKIALGVGSMLGMNKGAAMLNAYFKANATQPVTISHVEAVEVPKPKYWKMEKNTQDIPTLCGIEDIARRHTEPAELPESPAAELDGKAKKFRPQKSYGEAVSARKRDAGSPAHGIH